MTRAAGMTCASCAGSMRAGARFCLRCGAAAQILCHGCGVPNPSEASFCEHCGLSLSQREPSAPPPEPNTERNSLDVSRKADSNGAERRQTTIMFCDLVDSTRRFGQLDPEDLRDVLQAFRDVVREIVARHDGFIASYLGDGVLVLFAYPRAHEDDAERAVRAGLELVSSIPAVTRHNVRLEARVGIATGITVIGPLVASGTSFDEIVVGQTTNLAARLQAIAGPNQVIVSEATQRLVEHAFDCEAQAPQSLKGFDQPVPSWLVFGERTDHDSASIKLRHRLLPIVGRDHELSVLGEQWRRACEGTGNLALIQGEPGVGKSRLVIALRDLVASVPHTVLRYVCAPRFQNSALFPVIRQVERTASIAPDDSTAQKLDKLEAFLAHEGVVDDVRGASAILAALLSVPFEERYPANADSPERQKAHTFQTLKGILYATAQRLPLLLIVEDIHWADPTTLALLTEVAAEIGERQIMTVVTVRPGFGGVCPPCKTLVTLDLQRMTVDQSKLMIEQLAHGKLRTDIVERIATKSEGVALFTEELTKMALESGAFVPTDPRRSTESYSSQAIPSTLQDSLAARLDRLTPVKDVVRAASAIGREFTFDLLAAVLPIPEVELRASLRSLISADIVHLQDEALQLYSFKHVLLQEAAHAMMVRGARQELHRRVAQTIEQRSADFRALNAEVLAHHFTEAGEPMLAVPYLQQSAERASARAAHTEARQQLLRALELLLATPASVERDELELHLSVALGLATSATQGYAAPEVQNAYQRSFDLSRSLGTTATLFPALRGLCTFYIVRAALETARDLSEECLRLAEASDDQADLIESSTALGYTLVYQGYVTEGSAHLGRAITRYREKGGEGLTYPSLQDPAVASLGLQAIAAWMAGDVRDADRLQAEALELVDRLGRPFNRAYAHTFAALLGNIRLRFDEAAKHAAIARQVAGDHGFTIWYGAATINEAIALGNSVDAAAAIPVLVHMLGLWQAGGAELSRPIFLWGLARCHLRAGDSAAALSTLNEAIAQAKRTGEGFVQPEIHRLRGELLHAKEAANRALWREDLLVAADLARDRGAALLELRALKTLCTLDTTDESAGALARLRELSQAFRNAGENDAELTEAASFLEQREAANSSERIGDAKAKIDFGPIP